MPKNVIDYSKSLIYKLCCRDATVTDIYIGSTTNFIQRKACHKSTCNNKNAKEYNFNVYRFIRDIHGWENWDMVVIESYECKTKYELHTRERYYIDLLRPTLNKNIPLRTVEEHAQYKEQYYIDNKERIKKHSNHKIECECRGRYTNSNKLQHLNTNRHKRYINNPFINMDLN